MVGERINSTENKAKDGSISIQISLTLLEHKLFWIESLRLKHEGR